MVGDRGGPPVLGQGVVKAPLKRGDVSGFQRLLVAFGGERLCPADEGHLVTGGARKRLRIGRQRFAGPPKAKQYPAHARVRKRTVVGDRGGPPVLDQGVVKAPLKRGDVSGFQRLFVAFDDRNNRVGPPRSAPPAAGETLPPGSLEHRGRRQRR